VFPAGRQLPYLRELDISYTSRVGSSPAVGSCIANCCPGLQCLDLNTGEHSREMAAPLLKLRGLCTLQLHTCCQPADVLLEVCQLTGLEELNLHGFGDREGLLLKLTQLKQLTRLACCGYLNWYSMSVNLDTQVRHASLCLLTKYAAVWLVTRNTAMVGPLHVIAVQATPGATFPLPSLQSRLQDLGHT
jgi:hypothetical protein